MKKAYLLLLVLQFGYSQQNFQEEWYSADTEHLPQNSVKSISPDKFGFIWMTTENGLVRFDGKKFKTYNSSTIGTLSNRFLYLRGSIEKDSLLTYTESNKDNVIINQRTSKKIKNSNHETSIDQYENNQFYLNNSNYLDVNFLNNKLRNKEGSYYLIEKDRILFFSKNNQKKEEIYQKYEPNNNYFLLDDELICLKKNGEYILFHDKSSLKNQILPNKKIKKIYNHLTQQFFICTDSEIYILKKTINKLYLSLVYKRNEPFTYVIKCLFYDVKYNKLFIGTGDRGLGIVTLNRFNVLTNPSSINNTYYATAPIFEDNILSAKGEIFNKNGFVTDLKLNPSGYQYGLAIDKKQNIWIQNNDYVVCHYKKTNYKTSKKIAFKNVISTIYCDSENKIWIGFKKETKEKVFVAIIDANELSLAPTYLKSLDEPVNFFIETKDNKMLMASLNNKIIQYDKLSRKTKKFSSGKNDIRSIFICKANRTWVCTYSNGLSLFENNTFYKLPIDDNLYLASAHCISEDTNGHFWISSNKGLTEVDKKSLLKYIVDKSPLYYHHYDTKNGFLTNEFNGGCQPCNIKLKDGYLVYPSLNGLVVFHPEKVNRMLPSGIFYMNEVEIDDRTTYFNDTLFTSRKNNRLKVKIDFPFFGNENNIHFEAKLLLNKNDKWVNISNERTISYTNLPPGFHTLVVRKLGDFSNTYQTKKITIAIPFLYYETLWFRILISLLIVACIVFIIRYRYNFVKKKNDQLEQIINARTKKLIKTVELLNITKNNLKQEVQQQKKLIGTISHDIKSPLKFLSITAKHLHDKALDSENANIKENAKIMKESASELYRFVENLVDYSKVFMEHNDLKGLNKENIDLIINEKINLFKNLALENNNQIIYRKYNSQEFFLNKRVLGIIIHNLLDNAIKNTHSGKIIISAKVVNNKIYLSVEDNGTGMTDEIKNYYINIVRNYEIDKLALQNYGLGLHMVLELLRLLKGDLKIESKEGSGTKISIILDII